MRLLTRAFAGLDRGTPATGSTNVRVARASSSSEPLPTMMFSGEQQ